MREVILNEKLWAETMIENADMGSRPVETLSRLARYYYFTGYRKREIGNLLEQHLLRSDHNVSIAKWQGVIEAVVKRSDRYPLIDIEGVPVTKNEIRKIYNVGGGDRV